MQKQDTSNRTTPPGWWSRSGSIKDPDPYFPTFNAGGLTAGGPREAPVFVFLYAPLHAG